MTACSCSRSPLGQGSKLLERYDGLVDQAQRAYLCGRNPQAIACYLEAFDTSVEMLGHGGYSPEDIQRVVEVSGFCFDLCPLAGGDEQFEFLEVAATRFNDIVCRHPCPTTRTLALSASADIAGLAYQLSQQSNSNKARGLLWHFKQQWATHAPELVLFH